MNSETVGIARNDPEDYDIDDVEYAMRVTYSGEFIHAAPWSVGSQGYANVSHGCTGMSTDNAGWLYSISKRGDVVEYTGTDRPMTLTNGYGDWNASFADYRQGLRPQLTRTNCTLTRQKFRGGSPCIHRSRRDLRPSRLGRSVRWPTIPASDATLRPTALRPAPMPFTTRDGSRTLGVDVRIELDRWVADAALLQPPAPGRLPLADASSDDLDAAAGGPAARRPRPTASSRTGPPDGCGGPT